MPALLGQSRALQGQPRVQSNVLQSLQDPFLSNAVLARPRSYRIRCTSPWIQTCSPIVCHFKLVRTQTAQDPTGRTPYYTGAFTTAHPRALNLPAVRAGPAPLGLLSANTARLGDTMLLAFPGSELQHLARLLEDVFEVIKQL